MITAYVFSTLSAAQACQAPVDAALGYPSTGVNVGNGPWVNPPVVTETYAVPVQHPTLQLWAYPADSVTVPILSDPATAAALNLPAPTTLDATWTPAPSGP